MVKKFHDKNFNEIFFQRNKEIENFFYGSTIKQKTRIERESKNSGGVPSSHLGMVMVTSYGGDDQNLQLEGRLKSNPQIIVRANLVRMFTASGECGYYGLRYGKSKKKLGIFPVINWINIDNNIKTAEEFFNKYSSIVEKYSH